MCQFLGILFFNFNCNFLRIQQEFVPQLFCNSLGSSYRLVSKIIFANLLRLLGILKKISANKKKSSCFSNSFAYSFSNTFGNFLKISSGIPHAIRCKIPPTISLVNHEEIFRQLSDIIPASLHCFWQPRNSSYISWAIMAHYFQNFSAVIFRNFLKNLFRFLFFFQDFRSQFVWIFLQRYRIYVTLCQFLQKFIKKSTYYFFYNFPAVLSVISRLLFQDFLKLFL